MSILSKNDSVTLEQFEQKVEKASGAYVVDFSASWCQPCKMLAPVFERVSQKYAGRAQFLKVDIDESVEVAAKYGVQSIPNLLFFKDGQVVDQSLGYINEAELAKKVDTLL
jgi:thioredoxin 1